MSENKLEEVNDDAKYGTSYHNASEAQCKDACKTYLALKTQMKLQSNDF